MKKTQGFLLAIGLLLMPVCGLSQDFSPPEPPGFSFIVTADMRQFAGPEYQTPQYFAGTCEAIKAFGKGDFMISPGDIDPPWDVLDTIIAILGADYPWYPIIGNHEAETHEDMAFLREYGRKRIRGLIRKGPANCSETVYSFDFKNAHFVALNEYCDGESDTGARTGNITPALYDWLAIDLAANTKPHVFVIGHEPILSIPDFDNGRHRHQGDSLDAHPKNSHRFQELLREHHVTAYITAHTHSFSIAKINGLWQLDAGHCRGIGEKQSRSTFLKVWVKKTECGVEVYRDDANGGPYSLMHTFKLN